MAGEENHNAGSIAAASEVSVPSVPHTIYTAAASAPPPSSRLLPYDTTTNWRPWPAFAVTLFIIALTVVVALGGSLLVLTPSSGSGKSIMSGKTLIPMLIAQIVMATGAVIAATAYGNRLIPALALKPPPYGFRSYATSLAAILTAVGTFTAGAYYLFSHDLSEDLSAMTDLMRGPWWPLALIVIGVGAPLSEELMFRGFLQTALVPTRLGYWGASVVTTTLWTVIHGYSLVGMLEVFLIGMIFCLILRRTGSLRVPIACHAIYNTAIALVLIFTPKEILGF